MSTGTNIITEALQEIGARSVVSPAVPESILLGMNKLNSLMELWLSRGIKLGTTPLSEPGDDLNEPADARSAIVSNLAIVLAPSFDNGKNIVSANLKSAATRGYNDIKVLYQETVIPTKRFSSTLPLGAGNIRIYVN